MSTFGLPKDPAFRENIEPGPNDNAESQENFLAEHSDHSGVLDNYNTTIKYEPLVNKGRVSKAYENGHGRHGHPVIERLRRHIRRASETEQTSTQPVTVTDST